MVRERSLSIAVGFGRVLEHGQSHSKEHAAPFPDEDIPYPHGGLRWEHADEEAQKPAHCQGVEGDVQSLGLGLLKDNDEDVTIFQGNR